jgi:hypothetical protein
MSGSCRSGRRQTAYGWRREKDQETAERSETGRLGDQQTKRPKDEEPESLRQLLAKQRGAQTL